jgi:hypothetical protein
MGTMVDGLFVGSQTDKREDYIRALKLPDNAGWGDISLEQNRRYFAKKERQKS